MLVEIRNARQVAGEDFRRWFTDEYFDLIVWYDDRKALVGFQLCYDKDGRERAVTWTRKHGFQHNRIDTGEVTGHAKMTPIVVADGAFSRDPVADRFRSESAGIERGLAAFVYETLKKYPGIRGRGRRDLDLNGDPVHHFTARGMEPGDRLRLDTIGLRMHAPLQDNDLLAALEDAPLLDQDDDVLGVPDGGVVSKDFLDLHLDSLCFLHDAPPRTQARTSEATTTFRA